MMKFEILNIKDLTEGDFAAAFESMSSERKARCLRFNFAEDRRRMAFGEMLLRKLISKEFNSENILIKNLPSGKPVAFADNKEIYVSISHSGDFVAAALCDNEVGIDLEVTREVKPDFIKKVLSADELEFVNESNDKTMAFLKVWTAKEAYLKLTGEGLSGLKSANVLPLIKDGEKDGLVLQEHHTPDFACTIIFKKI